MAKQKLYNEDINEFIDWVSGKNSLNDTDATGGLPVSGASIRKLLQSKLKLPFVFYEDVTNNVYKMFSSEQAKQLYLSDKDTYQDLMLFSFVRPSDYELSTDISPNTRYLISGDDTQVASLLTYTWGLKKGNSISSDSVTAIYTITDTDGNTTSMSQIYTTTQTTPTFNFYKYLKNGTNTISVSLKGNTTGAITSASFPVVLLTLELASDFPFNQKNIYGENLTIPYSLSRNITSIATSILFYIDGAQCENGKIDIKPSTAGVLYNSTFSVPNIYDAGQHTLQMWAEITYNGNTFRSNILYFTFETASSDTKLNYFINVKNSFKSVLPPIAGFYMTGTQYEPITLNWGYYTDNLITDTSLAVTWKLLQDGVYTELATITANRSQQSSNLVFIPSIFTTEAKPITLIGYNGTKELINIPITISESELKMYECAGYDLKLTAYGKTNNSDNKASWINTSSNADKTTSIVNFTGINWDNTNGWYNNSLRVSGESAYAVINYKPFSGTPSAGRTIEFEFESEKVNSDSDTIIQIGGTNGGRIIVTPNSATLYSANGIDIVHTNFKANERVKLAFIINPENTTVDSNLVYIVNNGILERGASCSGIIFKNDTNDITIGKSKSGIKLYSMRVYNRAISYTDEYNNFVFDSDNKTTIISNNNVVKENILNYDLCVNKIDTILITGDLSNILNQSSDKDNSTGTCTIERICPFDSTKNFKVVNAAIRKHGQSTLNYPITSMKFWTSKAGDATSVTTFECKYQEDMQFAKNRYMMKNTSIPANKFILQANYADSSGVQNGGLERLIQNTWYNAKIDNEYKLRTEPQLFSTNEIVHHNNTNLGETNTISGYNKDGKQWGDYIKDASGNAIDFPYNIEIAPDSFPCVVFYQGTNGDNVKTFLGQYVFMEDKKSDFCYGERSIYKFSKDPFCLTIPNKSSDTDANKIWDNSNVLRMEVLQVNSLFSSYMSKTIFDHNDANGNPVYLKYDDIIYDSNNVPTSYVFENHFEMIYPDPDDVAGNASKNTDKFGSNSKFKRTVQPFLDWFDWIVSTYKDQNKFQAEAAAHLDLYKMAAYYIIYIRFGLVDTPERNSQVKTYDGVHFHYEPWDMDIGVGKKNTGGIAFDPPMDRTTTLASDTSTYAMSGRAGIPGSSSYTSNWLWDALEAWPEWINNVVPKVAQALYVAGLSYDNVMNMFDEEYAAKWCEIIYNESGHYKYITASNGAKSWLAWLQGASTTYRHWWLSVSMDYYDAKWNCGDFKNHSVYFGVDHNATTAGQDIITISPNTKTFFNISRNYIESLMTMYATKDNPARYDASLITFATKEPLTIYGATYIEELDISCMAIGIDTCNLSGAYSNVLGAPIKVLNVGIPVTQVTENQYTGIVSGRKGLSISAITNDGNDALKNIQTLYIRGQQPYVNFDEFYTNDRSELKNVYAMGSGLSTFYSSKSGNNYNILELPGVTKDANGTIVKSLSTIYLVDSSWETMTFWDTSLVNGNHGTFDRCNIEINNAKDYTYGIPASLRSVTMLGTTCTHENSLKFVREWIKCIEQRGENIGDYTLIMSGVDWSNENWDLLTFDELEKISKFNNGKNNVTNASGSYNISGYVVLNTNNTKLTAQELTQIKTWFGDTVFSKNSAGLIVDHKMNYIQINVGSDATTSNSLVYLKEGKHASLNATKFSLGETDVSTYNWFLKEPNSDETSQQYRQTYLSLGEDKIMYIYSDESSIGDYQVDVVCTSNTTTDNSEVLINIQAVTYPAAYSFNAINKNLRSYEGSYVFYKSSMSSEFYISADKEFTATIKDVVFKITDESGTVLLPETSYKTFKEGSQSPVSLDSYLAYIKSSTKEYGMTLYSIDVDVNKLHKYIVTAKVIFKSSYSMTVSTTIVVIDDKVAIIANDSSLLYQIVNAKYEAMNGGAGLGSYYKSDLISFTGEFSFITKTEWLANTTLKTQNNRSLLKYLPNVTSLIFDGSTIKSINSNINYTGDTTKQLVFDGMTSLQTLSIQNCTSLTEDIDLSTNLNLTTLLMSGTTINAILPKNSKLSRLALGTPTAVSINTPTQLTPDNITIDNAQKINSLELIEMPGNKTFSTFAKIINL